MWPGRADTVSLACGDNSPIQICVLGNFQVLRAGQAVAVPAGGKTEALLSHLAWRHGQHLSRSALLDFLWPDWETSRASQSLNSLVYSIHKLLGNAPDGASPVQQGDGYCWLNPDIQVDVVCFTSLSDAGFQHVGTGHFVEATEAFEEAIALYRGDLVSGDDITAVVEREHLRAHYLSLLAWLADHAFEEGSYAVCLEYATTLLQCDPFREDAHRTAMRCYVRRGERAQALRQYRLCQTILCTEFGADPEPATTELYDQVRCDPRSI